MNTQPAETLNASHRVLCAGTVRSADFRGLVAAAAAGGYDAISLFPALYRRAREKGLSDADLRNLLADHGLSIAELDPLLNWVPGHDFHAPTTIWRAVAKKRSNAFTKRCMRVHSM